MEWLVRVFRGCKLQSLGNGDDEEKMVGRLRGGWFEIHIWNVLKGMAGLVFEPSYISD